MRGDAEPRTLAELVAARAATRGTRPAVGDDTAELDYAALAVRVAEAAGRIAEHGVVPGDRVAVVGRNRVEWVVAALGIAHAGGVVVPFGHSAGRAEVTRLFDALRPRLVIAESAEDLPAGVAVLRFADLAGAPAGPMRTVDPDGAAVVMSSSGTSGAAKHVTMSHRQLLRLYGDLAVRIGITEDDRLLGVVPLAHSFGLNGVLLMALCAGAHVRLVPRYDRHGLAGLIAGERLSVLLGPPTVYHDLAASGPLRTDARLAITGSTEVPLGRIRAACDALGVPEIVVGYGTTETCGTVAAGRIAPDSAVPWLSPLPGVEVRIADAADGTVPAGTDGRILVRGYNVVRPGAGGWLDTGDIGRLDEGARLCVTGRGTDLVMVSGFTVHPGDVESALLDLPGIAAAAVVGVPDSRRGQRLVAFVVPAAGTVLDEGTLLAHARTRLAGYQVPAELRVVESLPLTANGKVSRAALRRLLGG